VFLLNPLFGVKEGGLMQMVFVALGFMAWIVAAAFGLYQTVEVRQKLRAPGFPEEEVRTSVTAPSTVSGAAAGGFAIGGGLCFVAAALVARSAPSGQNRPSRAAQEEREERDIAATIAALEGERQ
jgi:hypothetical protein